MNKPAKIPCKDCLCKAICHHKPYVQLLEECSIIQRIIRPIKPMNNKKYWKTIVNINKEIKAYRWSVEYNEITQYYMIVHKIMDTIPESLKGFLTTLDLFTRKNNHG